MPELPEVETIRLYLHQNLIGKKVENVIINVPKMFHGNPKDIVNAGISNTQRKGKVLTIELTLNNSKMYLSFHLKLSGQILFSSDGKNAIFPKTIPLANTNIMPAKTTRIYFTFTDGSSLYFNDLRKFGWVKLSDAPTHPIGIDVLSKEFTREYLFEKVKNTRRPIKTVLLDQDILAGIGNIYANDSLWEAKIHPAKKANTLSFDDTDTLFHAVGRTIQNGLRYKGSSAKDELYVLPDGTAGTYQHHFKTYSRDGQKCMRCRGIIIRTVVGGRGTFHCPECQL